jgi:hypothetical protein
MQDWSVQDVWQWGCQETHAQLRPLADELLSQSVDGGMLLMVLDDADVVDETGRRSGDSALLSAVWEKRLHRFMYCKFLGKQRDLEVLQAFPSAGAGMSEGVGVSVLRV